MMIGEAIKAERERQGLTLDGLGHSVGLSFQNVWNYEKGRVKLPQEKLEHIALALGANSLGLTMKLRETLTETRVLLRPKI